jgi:hypothetical protein
VVLLKPVNDLLKVLNLPEKALLHQLLNQQQKALHKHQLMTLLEVLNKYDQILLIKQKKLDRMLLIQRRKLSTTLLNILILLLEKDNQILKHLYKKLKIQQI